MFGFGVRRSREYSLYVISFLADYAYMSYVFTVSRQLAEMGASLFQLGILGLVTSGTYAIVGPLAGHLSDRWGRKWIVVLGSLLNVVALTVCSQSHSPRVIYAVSALAGGSVGMIFPPVIAWLTQGGSSSSSAGSSVLFKFCIAWNLGMIAGQAGGGLLFPIDHSLPLLAAVLPMLAAAFLAARIEEYPEPDRPPDPVAAAPVLPAANGLRFAYLGWTANMAGSLTWSTVVHLFPHLVHQLGIGAPTHGAMLAVNRTMVIVTYAAMNIVTFWRYRLSSSLGVVFVAIIGAFLLAVGTGVAALTAGLILLALLLGFNYFSSLWYSTVEFGDHQKGMASGIHEATLAVGFVIGALGGGILGTWLGPRAPYYLCIAALVLSALAQVAIYLVFRKRRRSVPSQGAVEPAG